ncbi:MAG: hypothetical protein QOE58_1960 [Actinomycetota bacterium]|nr:hypothetical protein [Actinomycetota bacterium]
MSRDPSHILFGVTSAGNVGFLEEQLQELRRRGWTCTVIASPDVGALQAPWRALRALVSANRPAITNMTAPGSGLFLGLAAAATRVPMRIYTVHGLRPLNLSERLSMAAAHVVVCVSPALRDRVLATGLTRSDKVTVIGTPIGQNGQSRASGQTWHEFYLDALYRQARGRHTPALRALDVLAAVAGGAVVAVPAAVVALVVRARLGSPVLFRQVRPGRDGVPFTLLKFRSMTDGTDALGQPLSDAERLTPLGELLRRTSLDELPSLWNILKGDMSLVGPRPLLTRYTPFFTDRERLRLAVRPGLTGWAQINGRNTSSWDERLGNDVWWVVNRSLPLYLRILCGTLLRVVNGTDVVTDTATTMQDLDDERCGALQA